MDDAPTSPPRSEAVALYEITLALGWRGPKWVLLLAGVAGLLHLDGLSRFLIKPFMRIEAT